VDKVILSLLKIEGFAILSTVVRKKKLAAGTKGVRDL
jgi:hypothetical protein